MEYALTIKEFINKIGNRRPLLGIDYGEKRIGLSLSDPTREFVFPIKTLNNKNAESSISAIMELAQKKNISGIVIGYPLQLDGTEGVQCKIVRNFVKSLLKQLPIAIFFQDERLSSKGAQTMLRELNLTRKQRDKKDDEIAACNILQTTLSLLKRHLS